MLRIHMPVRFGTITLEQARTPGFKFRFANTDALNQFSAQEGLPLGSVFVVSSKPPRQWNSISRTRLDQEIQVTRYQLSPDSDVAIKDCNPYSKTLRFSPSTPRPKGLQDWVTDTYEPLNARVKGDRLHLIQPDLPTNALTPPERTKKKS